MVACHSDRLDDLNVMCFHVQSCPAAAGGHAPGRHGCPSGQCAARLTAVLRLQEVIIPPAAAACGLCLAMLSLGVEHLPRVAAGKRMPGCRSC